MKEQVDIEDQLEMIVNMDELFNISSFLSKIKVTILTILFCKNPKKLKDYYKKKELKFQYFQFFVANEQEEEADEDQKIDTLEKNLTD